MNRTIPVLAALLAFTACDRSDPPVNQVSVDLNAVTPAPEPAPPEPAPAPANTASTPAAAATNALPVAYHGVFDQTEAACKSTSSIYRLTVSGGEMRFHESLADIKSVTPDGADAVRVAANYSGEGMEWSNIQRVALSDGGRTLTITGEGDPVRRTRCAG
jgi:hypothetical protein